ncbi:MAG TPA: hypothetical protein ENK94_04635 [Campylobacterales bacterium]|nr:hypothetical protein [Campylobacterales bacterium]
MVKNIYLNYLISFIFALIFVYVIPWVGLFGEEFHDIHNYLDRIVYLNDRGTEREYAGLLWFLSEPLWKEILIFIGYAFEDYREVIYALSFGITFVYVSFLIKRVHLLIAIIFLFNPMMVHLFMEQIRIAIAFCLVLIAYDLSEDEEKLRRSSILLLIMAPLIHTAILVFYFFYYLLYKLNEKVEDKKYYLIAIITAFMVAFLMKYGANLLLVMLGDRRANYSEVIESSSIAYSIAWFIIAIIVGTFAEFKERKERVLVAYAIMVMCFFFFSSLLNVFAARYVAVIMPLIIISISYLPKHFKQGTYLFLLAYNLFSFKYWLKLSLI